MTTARPTAWLRVCGVMFAVGWGANQFSSLLLASTLRRGVSEGTGDALFGVDVLGLSSGLGEVQRLAGPGELGSLTAVFHALTYLGFASPLIVSELTRVLAAPTVQLCGAGLAAVVLASVLVFGRESPGTV